MEARESSEQWADARLLVPVLMAGAIGQALIFTIVSPILPALVARSDGDGAALAQFIFALPSLGKVLIGFVGGWLLVRIGARTTMLWGIILFMLLGVLPMASDSLVLLLSSRLGIGLVCGGIAIAASVTLVARYEGAMRNAMLGYQSSVGSAAGLVGLILAGAIAARLDWELAFLLFPLAMLPLLILAYLAMPKRRADPPPAGKENLSGQTLKLLWPVYVAAAFLFMAPTLFGALTPFLLIERLITNPLVHALVIAMATIGTTIGGVLFGRVHAALGNRRTAALGAALIGGGALLMGLATGIVWAGAATFIAGLGLGTLFPYLACLTAAVPEKLRGHAFALLGTATYLGGFLYPLLVTPLLLLVDKSGVFLAAGLALLLAAAAALGGRGGRLVTA